MCDKKHANKHQAKEDQTHMPLPPYYILPHYYMEYIYIGDITIFCECKNMLFENAQNVIVKPF